MGYNAGDAQDGSPGERDSGLESHLRGLILTNATARGPNASNPDTQVPSPASPSSSTTPGSYQSAAINDGSPNTQAQQDHRWPKPGRKRPNQAQRRQMGSQFSIPVDHATQAPPPLSPPQNRPAFGHHHQTPPSHPRQQMPHSQPPPGYGRGHTSNHFSPGPWNTSQSPRHQQPQGFGGNFQPHPHQQHRGAPMFPEESSPLSWRRATGAAYQPRFRPEEVANQCRILEDLCFHVVSTSGIQRPEISEKEDFRVRIEQIARQAITKHEEDCTPGWDFPSESVQLKCFGSLSSGFATKASDMDLGLLSPRSSVLPDAPNSPIPRLVEKALLDAGIGARLLTRTRVPIIKLCENPPSSLYQDLLAQREKWENGTSNEIADVHEDDDQEPIHDDDNTENNNDPELDDWLKLTEFEIPDSNGGQSQRYHLRQRRDSPLAAYYGLAKRVLHKVGGRDVRNSSASDLLIDRDWEILNIVCKAFITGLHDQQLRQRLSDYPSLNFKEVPGLPDRHSLQTVASQVEGEATIQLWRTWLDEEQIVSQRSQLDQAIATWYRIMKKQNYGFDPMTYYKEVQTCLERIKRQPAIQLLLLEQGLDEPPSRYHARTKKIVNEVIGTQGLNCPRGQDVVLSERYIDGIRPKEVRAAVKDALGSTQAILNLNMVGRRHKSLHLAREFQKALDKGYYASEAEDVKKYIAVLQAPVRKNVRGHADFDFVIPLFKRNAELISRIKAMQDPHTLTPNLPKDRYKDRLEFPKDVSGVQCDINFSAHLALQNTLLLRCYSHMDPRVRPMVLFVKHWAKKRAINSGYRGTLSSYGYVLMVLHYLTNVVQPFVCRNLQLMAPPVPPNLLPEEIENNVSCKGYNIQFWRNEEEIQHLAAINQINQNIEPLGSLLRGFFEYYATNGPLSNGQGRGFDWGRDVLSIRTPGGLLSKQEKGWTGAKTLYEPQGDDSGGIKKDSTALQPTDNITEQSKGDAASKQASVVGKGGDVKEVRLRYLFAIEDPFELEHNVARTVTHNGIVSIRDEFRRAWRLIRNAGTGNMSEDLLQDANDDKPEQGSSFAELLYDIHGPAMFDDDD